MWTILVLLSLSLVLTSEARHANLPIVLNTWPFVNATARAWDVLNSSSKKPALDAVLEVLIAACVANTKISCCIK